MQRSLLLEITVEDVEAAIAAERGGADRIELCADLASGGVTPSDNLLQAAQQRVTLPIFSMIRPRPGNFVYSAAEFEQMKADIRRAKAQGVKGVVFGILNDRASVDFPRTLELVELARPLPVTFHRAFDEVADLFAALEDVISTGAKRILTSGGGGSVPEGLDRLRELVRRADEGITIVPGGGINAGNLARVVSETGAREFHSGLSSAFPFPRKDHTEFEEGVRSLSRILKKLKETI